MDSKNHNHAHENSSTEQLNHEQKINEQVNMDRYEKAAAPRKPIGIGSKLALLGLGLILTFGLGYLAAHNFDLKLKNNAPVTGRQTTENDGNVATTDSERNISNVVKKVSPSVVSIVTKSVESTYFGPTEQAGAGTGIIVSKDGIILTNKHVASGASTYQVVLDDGTAFTDVKLLGEDPLNDIAFLKVNGVKDLQPAELGDSTTVSVGQDVVAIGNSLGQYQNTVTNGIISGTGRPVTASDSSGRSTETLTDLLQTDAAINPGNSGGPLLNLSGQVIGINTATASEAQGMGFAIPINSTKGMLKSILAGKQPQRAYLGVSIVPITADVAKKFNLSVKKGAYVYSDRGSSPVVQGSSADQAGIENKDIITKINGVQVGDKGSVSSLVAEYAPGDTIEVTVLRGGSERTLKATLQAYPAQE